MNAACSESTRSALENPHTLRHEYAHQVQNQVYIARGTTLDATDCGTNDDFIHTPVHYSGPKCAWAEGWAFFMAVAYDGRPVYQPSYMAG